jgi:hypothetical protein
MHVPAVSQTAIPKEEEEEDDDPSNYVDTE